MTTAAFAGDRIQRPGHCKQQENTIQGRTPQPGHPQLSPHQWPHAEGPKGSLSAPACLEGLVQCWTKFTPFSLRWYSFHLKPLETTKCDGNIVLWPKQQSGACGCLVLFLRLKGTSINPLSFILNLSFPNIGRRIHSTFKERQKPGFPVRWTELWISWLYDPQ